MFKQTFTYMVDSTTYLDKVFKALPTNAFIDKGRCGIGGTQLELLNKLRSSIIIVPTIGILKCKKAAYTELLIVYGDTTVEMVKIHLLQGEVGLKIMSTPEGFAKVIKAASDLGILKTVYQDWFLLLDECHSYITEEFRKDILVPFDYFWEFDNKSLISATPYHFNDSRFQALDYHKIIIVGSIDTVNLVDCKCPMSSLNWMLLNSHVAAGNLYIFLNSVTAIKQAIEAANITDCNIYCADDLDKKNMDKLGDLARFHRCEIDNTSFKKINFLTSRYFEGCDIYDPNATIILVSDIHKPHTKVSVGMKLKQAAGRLRLPPEGIYHLTNHRYDKQPMQALEAIKVSYFEEAESLLIANDIYLRSCKSRDSTPDPDPRLDKYCVVNKITGEALLHPTKLDQQINEAYSHEVYNNISYIEQEWRNGYYNVTLSHHNLKNKTNTEMKRASKSNILKADIQELRKYNETSETTMFHFGNSIQDEIKLRNPLAYTAFKLLKEDVLEELEYNLKKVKAEVIAASNVRAEVKLLRLLENEFTVGERYSITRINTKLQAIYNMLDIRDIKSGNILQAEATQLGDAGRFQIHPCKMKEDKSNGYEIVRAHFSLKMAA